MHLAERARVPKIAGDASHWVNLIICMLAVTQLRGLHWLLFWSHTNALGKTVGTPDSCRGACYP